MTLATVTAITKRSISGAPESGLGRGRKLQSWAPSSIQRACCSVPCQSGSSRRASQSKPTSCPQAANGCTRRASASSWPASPRPLRLKDSPSVLLGLHIAGADRYRRKRQGRGAATGGSSGRPFNSPAAMDGSSSQLVQAMAAFGGGAADSVASAPLSADTSQQAFLTTSHA